MWNLIEWQGKDKGKKSYSLMAVAHRQLWEGLRGLGMQMEAHLSPSALKYQEPFHSWLIKDH